MGGLVHFDGSASSYRASRARIATVTDDLVSASLFGRFPVNFVNLKHNKQKTDLDPLQD